MLQREDFKIIVVDDEHGEKKVFADAMIGVGILK